MTCRICAGPLAYRFSLDVLQGRHRAEYHECGACRSLQVPDPHWLGEAYGDPAAARRADGGRFRRTYSAFLYLSALMRGGAIPAGGKMLDFGGGYGLLAQMLLNAGHDAWTSDAFESNRLFAIDRWVENPAQQAPECYSVITALEVFEHLTKPCDLASDLRRVLRRQGSLVISTGIYDPKRHGPDWPYLAPETGQHVTFYSSDALKYLAQQLGFGSMGYFPGDQGILIVFSGMEPRELSGALARSIALLNDPTHAHNATKPWDLRTDGWVPSLREAIVDDLQRQA